MSTANIQVSVVKRRKAMEWIPFLDGESRQFFVKNETRGTVKIFLSELQTELESSVTASKNALTGRSRVEHGTLFPRSKNVMQIADVHSPIDRPFAMTELSPGYSSDQLVPYPCRYFNVTVVCKELIVCGRIGDVVKERGFVFLSEDNAAQTAPSSLRRSSHKVNREDGYPFHSFI